jgi:hypothetical protein
MYYNQPILEIVAESIDFIRFSAVSFNIFNF